MADLPIQVAPFGGEHKIRHTGCAISYASNNETHSNFPSSEIRGCLTAHVQRMPCHLTGFPARWQLVSDALLLSSTGCSMCYFVAIHSSGTGQHFFSEQFYQARSSRVLRATAPRVTISHHLRWVFCRRLAPSSHACYLSKHGERVPDKKTQIHH